MGEDGACSLCGQIALCTLVMGKWACEKCLKDSYKMSKLMAEAGTTPEKGRPVISQSSKSPYEVNGILDIRCNKCGNRLFVPFHPDWMINIIGGIQALCKNCDTLINSAGLWSTIHYMKEGD